MNNHNDPAYVRLETFIDRVGAPEHLLDTYHSLRADGVPEVARLAVCLRTLYGKYPGNPGALARHLRAAIRDEFGPEVENAIIKELLHG